jgi:large subunit ribosomal protein L25
MATVALEATPRSGIGKQVAKHLRVDGQVPAVVYRSGQTTVPLAVEQRALAQVLKTSAGENVLITLHIQRPEGKGSGAAEERTVMIREIQKHPITGAMLHVDFHEVLLTERIKVKVPIVTKGEPVGVKQDGGVLDHLLWELEIECLPTQIPEQIEVDVAALKIGDSIPVKALALPEGVTALADAEAPVVAVAAPQIEKVEEPAEAVAAEPEVLKQKKVEEEAEAAPEKGGEKAEKKVEKKAEK